MLQCFLAIAWSQNCIGGELRTIDSFLYGRFEVNMNYKGQFEKKGLLFSGNSPDKSLPEIIELKNHPWFIGVQFHPEFKSRPLAPHPLFSSFIKAAKNHKK